MEIFQLLGRISIDTTEADTAIDQTSNRARDAEKKQSSAFSKIGGAAVAGAKVVAGAGAAMGGAFVAAVEGTRDYRVSMGMLESAYLTAGHSSEVAKSTFSDLNSVMRDSEAATEASQHLALVADNESELNELTHSLTGVYATFGASLPLEGLAEAINHSSSLGEVQGSLADALEWSGITVDDFNEQLAACSTEEERQDLIMKTLKDTYGKAADQYKETNKDVIAAEKAQEKLSDAMAEVGEVGEPILTAIKNKVADMVTAAVPKLEKMIGKFKDAKKWIEKNHETIDKWVAVILGATVSIGAFLLILKWGTIMTSAANAVKAVRIAILALNTALRANPIGVVISLISGLVAAFIYLWNNNESFRKFWLDMWEKIKSATGTAVKWIKDKFNDFKDVVSNVKKRFGEIKDAISDKINGAKDTVKKAIDKIKGFFPLSIGKIFSNLKIPSISVSGGKAPFGIAGKGKLPSFDVKWNAEGAIFRKPTIFDTEYGLQGVGEAGAEAIAPIKTLQAYIDDSVNRRNTDLISSFENQISRLISFVQDYFPAEYKIMLDTGILAGEMAGRMDSVLGERYKYSRRGNTR